MPNANSDQTLTIDPNITVNQLLQIFPAAVTALALRGIDTCCRGNDSLATAASTVGADLNALIIAIAASAADEAPAAPSCGCSSKRGA